MNERPALNKRINVEAFTDYYWLKDELVDFCKKNGIPTSGGKIEISKRITHYLKTGEIVSTQLKRNKTVGRVSISEEMLIEPDFVCSEKHRVFFKNKIGKSFSFNVTFQKWLKNNTGKTYNQAIKAYDEILVDKKKNKPVIDKQFEYNTYIRAFFLDNQDKTLKQATECWNYKKSLKGHNQYEKTDLIATDRL